MNLGQTGRVRPDARLFGALGALVATLGLTVWGLTGGTTAAGSQTPTGPIVQIGGNPSTNATSGHGAYNYSSTLTTSVQGPTTAPNGYRLAFQSNFTGSTIDRTIWGVCYPYKQLWGNGDRGCTNFGNNEYEWYMPQQIKVSNGVLELSAARAITKGPGVVAPGGRIGQKRAFGPLRPATYYCRSGYVNTYPSFNFQYGIVQVVAKMSGANGMWPALWLAASNRGWPPEVDLMEHFFGQPRLTAQFNHYGTAADHHRAAEWWYWENLAVGWHTYMLVWTPGELAWYVDGRVTMTTFHDIPHQKMFFVANLANLAGPVPGQPPRDESCGGSLDVSSVKVWQPN